MPTRHALFVTLLVLALAACSAPESPTVPSPEPGTRPSLLPVATVAETVQSSTTTRLETAEAPSAQATHPAPPSPAVTSADSSHSTISTRDSVRIYIPNFPDTLDPQLSAEVDEQAHLGLIYEGLASLNTDLQPIPAAAESWSVSEDGRVYTFKLRPELTYSDGAPLTANRFEYALKRAADPTIQSPYQTSLFVVEGVEAYASASPDKISAGELKQLRDNVGIKALDERTLQIRLTHPAPYLPYIMTLAIAYPVREEIVGEGENWWRKAENHVGNGPFVLSQLSETDRRAVFVPNPNWRSAAPSTRGIVYRYIDEPSVALEAYENNELDVMTLMGSDLAGVQTNAPLRTDVVQVPGACSSGFAFNLTKPPFDNRDVRLALAKALNRDELTSTVLHGQARPSLAWLVPGIPGYDPRAGDAQAYEPTVARELLAKAGFQADHGFPEIKFSYVGTPERKALAEFVASEYRRNLGIELSLEPMEARALTALSKDSVTAPALLLTGWCSDYPDAQDWFSTYWRSSAFARQIGYKNSDLDKLMDDADHEPDPARRVQMYHAAERTILDEDVVFMPTHQSQLMWLVKPHIRIGRVTSHDNPLVPGWFEPWKLGARP